MKKKNNKKWTLVLVLLLVVSIGYAALASNLKINGTSGVKSATWDVYWNNVQVTQGSVETTQGNQARITDQAKTQVEYSVVLNEPGDFYEFTVDAVNNGTIDAMIAANGIVNGVYSDPNYQNEATLPDAIKYSVTYADGTTIEPKHLLAKKSGNTPTTETYKVRIEYRNDDSIDPEDLEEVTDQTYYFKFSVNYVQAENAVSRNVEIWNRYYYADNDTYEITYEAFNGVDTLGDNLYYGIWGQENTVTNQKQVCATIDGNTVCLDYNHYDCGTYSNFQCSNSTGYVASKIEELKSIGGNNINCDFDYGPGCQYVKDGLQLYFTLDVDGNVHIGDSAYACQTNSSSHNLVCN